MPDSANKDKKQNLVELGAEILADALLDLAARHEAADALVERLVASPAQNVRRFKAKLSRLQPTERFIPWNEAAGFAYELETLLEDLKAGVTDARNGVELMAAFYEHDKSVFDDCDDSYGEVGDVFRYQAKELFVDYASGCQDKEWLSNLVIELNKQDEYGLRSELIDCATKYLPEPIIRKMVSRLQDLADKENNEYQKQHWLLCIESLAVQIQDAPLFEKTRTAARVELSVAACVDIARVYLQSGDEKTALSWLNRIPLQEDFHADERDELLLETYGRLGDAEKQADVAWRIFRRYRCAATLESLLDVIGHDRKNEVIAGEVANILAADSLSLTDAEFLVEMEQVDAAETYVLDHINQLNGDYYDSLLPLGEDMEEEGRQLAATAIYRALLDSILSRAKSKAYWYGAHYLKKLDQLAGSISDWSNLECHAVYSENLRQKHGRKRSFWSRYES